LSTVERLTPRAAPQRSPRQRLAEVAAQAASLTAQLAEFRGPNDERAAAAAALPAAEEALKALLLTEALGEADTAALAASKAEVRRLRGIAATADNTAAIVRLNAEIAQLGEARRNATRSAILAECQTLTAEFQAASKRALVAQAALRGLRAWAVDEGEHVVFGSIDTAEQLHHDAAESANRSQTLGGVLTSVRLAWQRLPLVLQTDAGAACPPLAEAVALIPQREEEVANAA
jgi:hypothetical protein